MILNIRFDVNSVLHESGVAEEIDYDVESFMENYLEESILEFHILDWIIEEEKNVYSI